jgi:hypothetical protein
LRFQRGVRPEHGIKPKEEKMETNVTVKFNPLRDVSVPDGASRASGRVTFDPDEEITFTALGGTVIYTLDQQTKGFGVVFPSHPIQWVQQVGEELLPIAPPSGVTVSRSDESITVTFMANLENMQETFRFYVIVQTLEQGNGRFFGSDPTIVTMPPGMPTSTNTDMNMPR